MKQQAKQEFISESVLDPERPIIDPHHHLARMPDYPPYLLDDFWADTGSGHNVVKTVLVECSACYREDYPPHLRPVSETEFAASFALQSRSGGGAMIEGIVAHADLRLGDALEEVLHAHEQAAGSLLKGIRHAGARDPYPEALSILLPEALAPAGLYDDKDFRQGIKRLGQLGYSFDAWHYHPQNRDFLRLARDFPDTVMILDHFGTPLGVGPYAGQRDAIFEVWKKDMLALAQCSNVFAKLGGLAMIDNGFGWHETGQPSSDDFVSAQAKYYHHMIECFGPERCMFESNFPVDKPSVSYRVLYNGFKKIAAAYSDSERHALFYGTAAHVYKL